MKLFALLFVSVLLSPSAFAASCAKQVEAAAIQTAKKDASDRDSYFIPTTRLLRADGVYRIYSVDFTEMESDGAATYDLPGGRYLVFAEGNQYNCKITGIKKR